MATKLTLVIEEDNIKAAKSYAKKNNTSVSAIVNDLFSGLRKLEGRKKTKHHPFVIKYGGIVNSGDKEALKNLFG